VGWRVVEGEAEFLRRVPAYVLRGRRVVSRGANVRGSGCLGNWGWEEREAAGSSLRSE